MKSIIKLVSAIALLGIGCGGETYSEEPSEESGAAEELGVVEQAIRVKPGATFTYGVSTAQSHLPCTFGQSSGAVCSLPINSNPGFAFSYCISTAGQGAFTAAEASRVDTEMQTVAVTLTNAFNPGVSPNKLSLVKSCQIIGGDGPDLTIMKGSVSGSGVNVYHYVSTALDTFGPVLTESPALNGTYRGHATAIMTIDLASIIADQSSTTFENRVLNHALGYGARSFMGLGGRAGSGSSYGSILTNTAITTRIAGNTGDVCRGSSYRLDLNPGTITLEAAACAD